MNRVDVRRPSESCDPVAYATFLSELQNAAACCKVVEAASSSDSPGTVLMRARREGATSITAVSTLSLANSACRQQFMVFEAKVDSITTYIIAFRAGAVSEAKTSTSATVKNYGQLVEGVDQAVWRLASSVPLRSLPPQWIPGLRKGRDRLILTGYSIGGAVAAVATSQLLQNAEPNAMRDQIRCFTFGAPLQGGKSYADSINSTFISNYYHAVYDGDPIPGILTLVNKVAKDIKLPADSYMSVVADIFALTGIAAAVAMAVMAPPAGVAILPIAAAALSAPVSVGKLVADFRTLVTAQYKSTALSLPEYEFGGTLLRMIQHPAKNITLGYADGNSEFLEKVFRVERHIDLTARSLEKSGNLSDILGRYLQIIKEVHDNYRSDANSSRIPAANAQVAQPSECLPFSFRPLHGGRPHEDGLEFRRTNNSWLLKPKFRGENPLSVFLDQNGRNITIDVHGENIVLGIHVLYLDKDGKEKLRVPCTGDYRPNFLDAGDQQSMALSPTLRFSAYLGDSNLSFKDGSFKVELAFDSIEVKTSSLEIRKFNPMDEIQVAARFASMPPKNLVEVLITSAKVTAQAMCLGAFNAILKNPTESYATVEATIQKFDDSPSPECDLLDHFLALIDASQLLWDDRMELPQEMQMALNNVRKCEEGNLLPLFPKTKSAEKWTFSECFKRAVRPMLTEENLSKKETAQKLRKVLDDELKWPKMVLDAFLDSKLEVKDYKKAFSFKKLKKWKEEKEFVKAAGETTAKVGGSLAIVSVPFWISADYVNNPYVKKIAKCVGGITGAPTALLGIGIFYSAWLLYHVALKPKRMLHNEPGFVDDIKRKLSSSSKARLDDWDTKLQAACLLYELKSQSSHTLACQMEFDLHKKLNESRIGGGCFNIMDDDLPFENTRHALLSALQVANYGSAGRWMHEVRRYLTRLQATVGLIGTAQAGKSCFARLAFGVDSVFGPDLEGRTRVVRRYSEVNPKPGSGVNRQFAVIDFPGCTDAANPDLYIRGLPLTSVLVVIMHMRDFTTEQAVALILEVCHAREKDETISALFCFTHADEVYGKYEDIIAMIDPARSRPRSTARQLFEENLTKYKNELRSLLEDKGCFGVHLNYVYSNIHACNFRPTLQADSTRAQELKDMDVKNVKWVEDWCYDQLANIS